MFEFSTLIIFNFNTCNFDGLSSYQIILKKIRLESHDENLEHNLID